MSSEAKNDLMNKLIDKALKNNLSEHDKKMLEKLSD
jgi:hypothetical protein